jgi:hypothetical protein
MLGWDCQILTKSLVDRVSIPATDVGGRDGWQSGNWAKPSICDIISFLNGLSSIPFTTLTSSPQFSDPIHEVKTDDQDK